MSLSILERPHKDVSGFTSKWSAVFNRILYKFQRRDLEINLIFIGGSGNVVVIPVAFDPSSMSKGDIIYINSGPYDVSGTVLDFNLTGFALDVEDLGASAGGYANLSSQRRGYRLETTIYRSDSFSWIAHGVSTNKPLINGAMDLDISSWLQTLMEYNNTFDYDTLNLADKGLGQTFNISVKELYFNSFTELDVEGDVLAILETNRSFFMGLAQQLLAKNGSNAAQYVPFLDTIPVIPEEDKMKFLSDFEEPVFFPGYPFDLQFIYGDNIGLSDITKEEEEFDINGGSLATSSISLDFEQVEFVNRLTLRTDAYPVGTESLDVWLATDGAAQTSEHTRPGYIAPGYFKDTEPPIG